MSHPTFDAIKATVQSDLATIEDIIFTEIAAASPLTHEIAEHIFKSGGKRLRPMIVMLMAKALGNPLPAHHDLGAIIEIIHTASLIHDDVVDNSDYRRKQKTANHIWDNTLSVLVGDYLYTLTFNMIIKHQNMEMMTTIASATTDITQGEILQLENSCTVSFEEDRYLKVVYLKTSTLFLTATKCTAILATPDNADYIEAARQYGIHLGYAFQIMDDLLDYTSDVAELGKSPGDDLAEGKITLPLIYAWRNGNAEQKAEIERAAREKDRTAITRMREIIAETDAIAYTCRRAEAAASDAKAAIAILPDTPARQALMDLAEFAAARQF